jgi:hypothetical protein
MQELEPFEPHLHRDRIQLPDGRYLIYYTFDPEIFLAGLDKDSIQKKEED